MRTILLLQVEPKVTSLLKERAGTAFRVEEVFAEEEGLARIRARAHDIGAFVIGAHVADPVRLTRDVSSMRSDLPIMILSAPEAIEEVKRLVQFSPFVGQAVYFESIGEEKRVLETFDALAHRLAQQKRYKSMLDVARRQLPRQPTNSRKSQLYLSAMLNHLPTGIVLLDEERRVVEWNRQAALLFAITGDAAPRDDVLEPLPPAVRDQLDHLVESSTEKDGVSSVLLTFDEGSSTPRYIEATAAPVEDDGRQAGTIISAMDVSERIRLEKESGMLREQRAVNDALAAQAEELQRLNEALQHSNEELEAFAYVASHDLQEPLRKITSFTGLLRADFGGVLEEEGLFYVDRVENASARMTELIRGLLAYSRVATRGAAFAEIDLNVVVERVMNDLEVSIDETDAQIQYEALPVLNADPIQMRQLFQNLIGNSIKFRQKEVPPRIDISSAVLEHEPDGRASRFEITVKDNGIGFNMKYAERIFSPFQRLHGHSRFEGSGMGLAICRRIAERHGGSITARSEQGRGTTFTIVLPAGDEKDSRVEI